MTQTADPNSATDPNSTSDPNSGRPSETPDPAATVMDGHPPRRRGRVVAPLIAAALALGLGVGAYWYVIRGAEETAVAAAPAAPPPPTVTVSRPVYREIVEWDEYTGQFAAVDYVEIRARVSGYLNSIHFEDGQIVQKGDLLFVIDPRPFKIELASAKAELAQATARLELANVQLARAEKLRENDFVAASTYDERNQERRVAVAAVELATAAVRAAELDLQFTQVRAPVTGRISRNLVSVGNLVSGGDSGGTTLLTTIVSLDPIYLVFDMSETNFLAYQRAVADGRLRSTRDNAVAVSAHLPDEEGWPHQGHMDFVDNQVDRTAGTMRARAIFDNPNLFITPGQFGRVRIPGSEPYKAIMVPESALVTDQSRQTVLVVQEDGTVESRIVRRGPRMEGLRIIREGLKPTDRIIINGLMRARPGAKVTPQPGKIEPAPQPS